MQAIDAKVQSVLKQAYQTAMRLIKENKELHIKITKDLLKTEEISEDEFKAYFK
jgi:ATP-dependent Zn protease